MKRRVGEILSHYERFFGCEAKSVTVNKSWDDEISDLPPIAICLFSAADTGRKHDVLISAGMSVKEMDFSPEYQGEKWSTELIMYVDDAIEEDIGWLRWLAELPFFDQFPLGYGHTVYYPDPIYSGSSLSKFLFLNTLIKNDASQLKNIESIHPVDLLWVVPVTSNEYQLKNEKGLESVLNLFDKVKHPIVLDRLRASYV